MAMEAGLSNLAKYVFDQIGFVNLQSKWVKTTEEDFKVFNEWFSGKNGKPLIYKTTVETDFDIVEDGVCEFFYDEQLTEQQKKILEKFATDGSLLLVVHRTDAYVQTWSMEVNLPSAPNKIDSTTVKFKASLTFSILDLTYKNKFKGEFLDGSDKKTQEQVVMLYGLAGY